MEASSCSPYPSQGILPFRRGHLAILKLLGGESPPGSAPLLKDSEEEGPEAERTVLLIDDELDSLEAIRELLELEGLRVLTAENGREALDLLSRVKRPALIVLDLRMPRMDGWEFCRVLESDQALADIPIAIVTASASVNQLPERRQAAGLFLKPIDFNSFLRMVKRYCG